MLNEKGLVVSSILYTLLIAFLLFLGVTLSTFQASSRLISNSNKDLINGTKLTATAIKLDNGGPCKDGRMWYQNKDNSDMTIGNEYLIKINSKYGTSYWPRDYGIVYDDLEDGILNTSSYNDYKNKINVSCSHLVLGDWDCDDVTLSSNLSDLTFKIKDTKTSELVEVNLSDFCG